MIYPLIRESIIKRNENFKIFFLSREWYYYYSL